MLNPNSQFMEAPVPRSVAHLVALAVSPRLPPVMGKQMSGMIEFETDDSKLQTQRT